MKLSLKQKALAQTIGMFALAIVTAMVVTFILANVFGIGAFAFLAYMFYSVTLSRLEYNEKLKEMTKKD